MGICSDWWTGLRVLSYSKLDPYCKIWEWWDEWCQAYSLCHQIIIILWLGSIFSSKSLLSPGPGFWFNKGGLSSSKLLTLKCSCQTLNLGLGYILCVPNFCDTGWRIHVVTFQPQVCFMLVTSSRRSTGRRWRTPTSYRNSWRNVTARLRSRFCLDSTTTLALHR